MKFSYTLLKRLVPTLPSKKRVIEALNMHVFEAEDMGGGTIDVSLSPNRYSDAASHIGIAKEAAAVLGLSTRTLPSDTVARTSGRSNSFSITVEEPELCPRYTAQLVTNIKVGNSPAWLKKVLEECGLRPINNVVDIMNYVMLETGQPLHAFDADQLAPDTTPHIVIRKAHNKEQLVTIDGEERTLDTSILVIADTEKPLAIAGIKGGKEAEVGKDTTRILVEAANFEPVSIYKTAQALRLHTDASLRFSHDLHPHLARWGLERAVTLLQELVQAAPGELYDSAPQQPKSRRMPFYMESYDKLIGVPLSEQKARILLRSIGIELNAKTVTIPPLRTDIQNKEDVIEEIVRLVGYDKLSAQPPQISLTPASIDDATQLKERIRDFLVGLHFDEVYTHSFMEETSEEGMELANPITEDKKFLRTHLHPRLLQITDENMRFFDAVQIFEVGHVFRSGTEHTALALVAADKHNDPLFLLRGSSEQLLQGLGITDFVFAEINPHTLELRSGATVLGVLVRVDDHHSYMECDISELVRVVSGEISYEPLPKFPAVMRDISLLVDPEVRIGDVIQEIQLSDTDTIQDVDLVDEYVSDNGVRQSITLRIVFRADDHTLEAEEVDERMTRISDLLIQRFRAQVR